MTKRERSLNSLRSSETVIDGIEDVLERLKGKK